MIVQREYKPTNRSECWLMGASTRLFWFSSSRFSLDFFLVCLLIVAGIFYCMLDGIHVNELNIYNPLQLTYTLMQNSSSPDRIWMVETWAVSKQRQGTQRHRRSVITKADAWEEWSEGPGCGPKYLGAGGAKQPWRMDRRTVWCWIHCKVPTCARHLHKYSKNIPFSKIIYLFWKSEL